MAIRPTVVYNYLQLRNRVRTFARLEHPSSYTQPPSFDEVMAALRELSTRLASEAVVVASDVACNVESRIGQRVALGVLQ